jgi:peptidoglycan/LPS O-acetylase OafA/YrhL
MPLLSPNQSERFVQLDALRFFFAVVVVMFHTIGGVTPVHGGYAVDFFFILSGFVLSHALIRRPVSAVEFAWARLARLYPLHLVTLGALVCLVAGLLAHPPRQYSHEALGLNLVLLQGIWALDFHAWNFPSWSISVEFAINVVLLYPIVRMRSVLLAVIVVLSSWLGILLAWGPVFDKFTVQPIPGTFLAGGLLRGAAGIVLGYLLYEAYLRLRPRSVRRPMVVVATGCEAMGICLLTFSLWTDGMAWRLIPAPLSALLILQMAVMPGLVSRALQGRLFAFLGNISYSIYLVHIPVFLVFVGTGFLRLGDTTFTPIWIIYFVLMLLLSSISYRRLEQPAQRGLMRLYRGWRTSNAIP